MNFYINRLSTLYDAQSRLVFWEIAILTKMMDDQMNYAFFKWNYSIVDPFCSREHQEYPRGIGSLEMEQYGSSHFSWGIPSRPPYDFVQLLPTRWIIDKNADKLKFPKRLSISYPHEGVIFATIQNQPIVNAQVVLSLLKKGCMMM